MIHGDPTRVSQVDLGELRIGSVLLQADFSLTVPLSDVSK